MQQILIVGAGGFVGAVLRYLIGLIPLNPTPDFPVKTFCINIIGAFVIGTVTALALKNSVDPKTALFLKTGICGGFTTFSSFALESGDLFAKGSSITAVLYMLLSVVCGVLAVFAAQKLFA
jgi:CrcB protein